MDGPPSRVKMFASRLSARHRLDVSLLIHPATRRHHLICRLEVGLCRGRRLNVRLRHSGVLFHAQLSYLEHSVLFPA